MRMDEYLKRKQELQGKQKEFDDKRKELEEAKRKTQEIENAMKAEKRQEQRVSSDFSLLGMKFRPWTLNDMVIILFVIGILIVGAASFTPGGDVSSDTDSPKEGFFDKLFGGFTVKTIENNQENEEIPEESIDEPVVIEPSTEEILEEITEENTNPVDFDIGIRYQDSPFTTINITNVDNIWYTLNIRNKESFVVKCNVNHYVNDGLKDDKSTVTIEAGNERDINLREMASDAKNTLSRVKLEVSCSDGEDSSTENTKVEHLKFYFS